MQEWLSQGWGYLIALAAGIGAIVSLSQNIKKLAEKLNEPNKRQDAKIEALETKVKDHNKNIDDRVGVLEEAMACMMGDIIIILRKALHAVISPRLIMKSLRNLEKPILN